MTSIQCLRVREARRYSDLLRVWSLVHDVYVAQGSARPQPDGLLRSSPLHDELARSHVLMAELNGEIVGTCSVTFDGPGRLPVDEEFPDLVALTREQNLSQGKRIACIWRYVVAPDCQNGEEIKLKLMAMAKALLEREQVGTVLMAVSLRHVCFLRGQPGAQIVRETRACEVFTTVTGVLAQRHVPGAAQKRARIQGRRFRERMPAV